MEEKLVEIKITGSVDDLRNTLRGIIAKAEQLRKGRRKLSEVEEIPFLFLGIYEIVEVTYKLLNAYCAAHGYDFERINGMKKDDK